MTDIDTPARIVWNYMLLHQDVKPADAIIVLGSIDLRIADRGAELYRQGLAPIIICTGNRGRGTSDFIDTEARLLARRLVENGIPGDKVLVEEHATNTGENATFTRALLDNAGIPIRSAVVVTKPYMERRAYATFARQWPELTTYITSPQLSYDAYFIDEGFKVETLNMMVGDLERMQRYAVEGFQIPQEVPANVEAACRELIALGYNRYLPKP